MSETDNILISPMTDNTVVPVNLFNYNFANLLNSEYLFDQMPESFIFSTYAIVIGVVGIFLALVILWILKKRREKLYVPKKKRRLLSLLFKVNLISSILFTLFALLRTQQIPLVSMRFWLVFFGLVNVCIYLISIVLYLIKEKQQTHKVASPAAEDSYTRFLPKKKRK